eukprot:COSAG04_NODE_3842_length_2482_cov_1.516995_2_plen_91_part_00
MNFAGPEKWSACAASTRSILSRTYLLLTCRRRIAAVSRSFAAGGGAALGAHLEVEARVVQADVLVQLRARAPPPSERALSPGWTRTGRLR